VKLISILLFSFLVATAMPVRAHIQYVSPVCDMYENVVKILWNKYREKPKTIAITILERVLGVFVSTTKERTWTLVLVYPNGLTCLIVAGNDWILDNCDDVVLRTGGGCGK